MMRALPSLSQTFGFVRGNIHGTSTRALVQIAGKAGHHFDGAFTVLRYRTARSTPP